MNNWVNTLTKHYHYWRFTTKHQQVFLDDLAALINDGISANAAVELMSYMSQGTVAMVVDDILSAIAQGKLIADGLKHWFPIYIVEIIRAGEVGGNLTSAMESAVTALGQKQYTMSAILASLTYPVIVIVMAMLVIVFLNHSIFTDFRNIVPMQRWPFVARALVGFAEFIQYWWFVVSLLIVLLITGNYYLFNHYIGKFRQQFDRLPLIRNFRYLTAARLLETLGLLVSNGLLVKQALQIIKEQAPPYLNWHIMAMEYRLASGRDNIGEILDTGLITDADIFRLRVIGKGRDFSKSLLRLGERAAVKTNKHLQHNAKITSVVLLCIGAGLAGLMILSIYGVGATIAINAY